MIKIDDLNCVERSIKEYKINKIDIEHIILEKLGITDSKKEYSPITFKWEITGDAITINGVFISMEKRLNNR